jgi:hypothetical protein
MKRYELKQIFIAYGIGIASSVTVEILIWAIQHIRVVVLII